ncbi:MAG: hypothetical protein M1827_001269 [Pycnora praestabilis]|nr:MAG: hypothetical protein M1827_001269 [Pycnora praestabilis]
MNDHTPATKRRRLDTASRTLSKPFKSPFKTPLKTISTETPTEVSRQNVKADPTDDVATACLHTITPENSSQPHAIKTPKPKSISSAPSTLPKPPALITLLKTQRNLECELNSVRSTLETLEQARRIETSNEDSELVELIQKWKGASREAAEEMFAGVRDRVNRLGGTGAWRDMQRKKAEWRSGGWDEVAEKKEGSEGEEAEEGEKRDLYAEYDIDPREEGSDKHGEVVVDEGKDDDAFTMDMMLKSLNIELEIIGYDKQQQRWAD